jgi:ribosomal protein S18 acetylase RimI-like enzyme
MTTVTIKTATLSESDKNRIIDVIVLSFCTDPVVRWTYPNPHEYLKYFPDLVRAFGDRAFEHKTAYYVDGFLGAALWLPPDIQPKEDEMIALLERTVSEQHQEEVFSLLEQMGSYHPTEPHWYLPMLGVDPALQGNGYGSALMKHALISCDRENKLAYLESSNPRNISLYQRHGFELLGTIQAGSSPSIFPMLRKPHS